MYVGFKLLNVEGHKHLQCAVMVVNLKNTNTVGVKNENDGTWLLDVTTGSSDEYILDVRGYLLLL